jgi:hypothetical protein
MSALVEYVGAFTETVLRHLPDATVSWTGDSLDRHISVSFDDKHAWGYSVSVEQVEDAIIPAGMAVLDATSWVGRIMADARSQR